MGICAGSLAKASKDENKKSQAINNQLKSAEDDEKNCFKLLLLGIGESGKSTIFKQMQILYEDGFRDFEKATFRHVIRRNVVEAMQSLVDGAARRKFVFASQVSKDSAKFIEDLDPLSAEFWSDGIVPAVEHLWTEPAIKQMYDRRSEIQLLDSTEYLFEHVRRIGAPDFSPTPTDILRARLRTSGIVEKQFKIEGVGFRFLDVGGQRNERRKWIHCFDSVTAVIFVAAISEYDQALYEDEKENRMTESLQVFDNICNSEYFADTTIILFLNKTDLFREKLTRVPLSNCFKDYTGDNSFDDAGEFIKNKFLAINQQEKMLFAHLTCSIDTKNVERVFQATKLTILQENLGQIGMA